MSNIANLPPELHGLILSFLPVIDRVSLALSCKSLASSAIASPQLTAPAWSPWLGTSEDSFPSRDLLLQRLAHGWTDKSQLRYCQTCRRILPKTAVFFEKELQSRKLKSHKLPYGIKVGMDKKQWRSLSTKNKYDHIIKLWVESKREDSSVFSCNRCWTREYNGEGDLEKGITHVDDTDLRPQVPVECPCCLIHSLVNTYKEPRKPVVRPFVWKWTKKTLSFVGNSILVFIYLIYLLFKAPFDIIKWLYKKYRASNVRPSNGFRRKVWRKVMRK